MPSEYVGFANIGAKAGARCGVRLSFYSRATQLSQRWYFRNKPDAPFLKRLQGWTSPAPRKLDDEELPGELRAWGASFVSKCRHAALRCVRNTAIVPNVVPLMKYAIKVLRASHFSLLPNDKDGGWCVLRKSDMVAAHKDILDKLWNRLSDFRPIAVDSRAATKSPDPPSCPGRAACTGSKCNGMTANVVPCP